MRLPAPRQVLLLSKDTSLVALFNAVLTPRDELAVVESVGELAAKLQAQPGVDAVVLDLPASRRREACEQIRERYRGRLLVAADQEAETQGWPADHARRFLIRPFPVAELSRALRMPIASVRAAAPPDEPPEAEALGPVGTEAAGPPPRRLSSDEPLWDTPAPAPDPGPPAAAPAAAQGPRRKAGPRRALPVPLLVAALLVLLAGVGTGGVAIGRTTAKAAPVETITITTGAPSPPTATNQGAVQARTPPACDAALTDADAAISYLIAHITDQRLSKALEQFQNDRRACRQVK
jgi:hypothetical protein